MVGAPGRALVERRGSAYLAVGQGFAARPLADVMGIEQRRHREERLAARGAEVLGRRRGGRDIEDFPGTGQDFKAVHLALRFLERQVPLAEISGGVAGAAEQRPHHGEFARIDGYDVVGLNAGLGRVPPGEHRSARRHAERVGAVGPRERHAVGGQAVHVRRPKVPVADAAAHGVGELLVRHDKQDVPAGSPGAGQTPGGCRQRGSAGGGEESTAVHGHRQPARFRLTSAPLPRGARSGSARSGKNPCSPAPRACGPGRSGASCSDTPSRSWGRGCRRRCTRRRSSSSGG